MLNGQLWADEGVKPSQQGEIIEVASGRLPSAAA